MLLRETGFSFGGTHTRDLGLIYAEKDGHIMVPRIRRNTYEIAGHSGNVLLSGETWETFRFEGTLYPERERATQAEAQTLLRQLGVWLSSGRQRLIFDYEPDKYYLAEISDEVGWSLKNWFGGEIGIVFEAQPFAYNVEKDETTLEWTGQYPAPVVQLRTGAPAPLELSVLVTGTAPLTRLRVNGGVIDLNGMSVTQGKTLRISLEAPAGAEIDGENALPYADAFAPVYLVNGDNTVNLSLTYGSGTKGVTITAGARGRY